MNGSNHGALRTAHPCWVETQRSVPCEVFLSPHPGPLPWGEGEPYTALVSDRIVSNNRMAATGDGRNRLVL